MNALDCMDDVIDALGGPTKVAAYLTWRLSGRVNPKTVSAWKSRGAVPLDYWRALIELGEILRVGVTAKVLIEIHSRPLPPLPNTEFMA